MGPNLFICGLGPVQLVPPSIPTTSWCPRWDPQFYASTNKQHHHHPVLLLSQITVQKSSTISTCSWSARSGRSSARPRSTAQATVCSLTRSVDVSPGTSSPLWIFTDCLLLLCYTYYLFLWLWTDCVAHCNFLMIPTDWHHLQKRSNMQSW